MTETTPDLTSKPYALYNSTTAEMERLSGEHSRFGFCYRLLQLQCAEKVCENATVQLLPFLEWVAVLDMLSNWTTLTITEFVQQAALDSKGDAKYLQATYLWQFFEILYLSDKLWTRIIDWSLKLRYYIFSNLYIFNKCLNLGQIIFKKSNYVIYIYPRHLLTTLAYLHNFLISLFNRHGHIIVNANIFFIIANKAFIFM